MKKTITTFTDLSAEGILTKIDNNSVSDIIILETVDSTNTYAKEIAKKGAEDKTIIIANHQTAGRGRLGREFYSPSDTGLYMSILLRPVNTPLDPSALTIAAGIAVCRTIRKLCNKAPQIKWVNDIFVDQKKVCGILAEAGSDSELLSYIIVGIGINLSTQVFPGELNRIAGSLGTRISRSIIAGEIINEFNHLRPLCGTRELIDEYKNYSLVLGKKISFTQNGEILHGIATDINVEGNLIVTLDNEAEIILKSGEISLGSANFSQA